jgi:hypothetical protein
MEHETGCGAVIAGIQPFRQGADVDALIMKLFHDLSTWRMVKIAEASGPDSRYLQHCRHGRQRLRTRSIWERPLNSTPGFRLDTTRDVLALILGADLLNCCLDRIQLIDDVVQHLVV